MNDGYLRRFPLELAVFEDRAFVERKPSRVICEV